MATTTAAGRMNFRVPPEVEQRLRLAAESTRQSLTGFVLGAAKDRAEDILATRTVLPAEYFDQLLAALDEPARPMPALRRALKRERTFVQK